MNLIDACVLENLYLGGVDDHQFNGGLGKHLTQGVHKGQ